MNVSFVLKESPYVYAYWLTDNFLYPEYGNDSYV